MKHLFKNPRTDNELRLESAFQLGKSEGREEGRLEGIAEAQAAMREAQAKVREAMGIREELGA